MIVSAPAKINLGLDILRKREDGFHELRTLLLEVSLADRLEAFAAPGAGADSLVAEGPFAEGVPTTPDNLVLRAVATLRRDMAARGLAREAMPLRFRLEKHVPHGAGLGGGSSDAAAALKLARAIWQLPASDEDLARIAASIGSDCAFFVRGGAAMGTGRGEILEPVEMRRALHLVLVLPPFGVSTRDAYAGLRTDEDFGERSDFDALRAWLGGAQTPPPRVANAFTRSVAARHPRIAEIITALRSAGALIAEMSGSGSVCFGIFEEPPQEFALEGCQIVRCNAGA